MSTRLSQAPLDVGSAYRALAAPNAGGVAVFVGRVRPDRLRSGTVRSLFYEADVRVAMRRLQELERTARVRFGLLRVILWHRLGTLRVGTPSVIVGASAAHRDAAFRGARYLIEALKREVPIWKSERVRPARPRPGPPGRRRAR